MLYTLYKSGITFTIMNHDKLKHVILRTNTNDRQLKALIKLNTRSTFYLTFQIEKRDVFVQKIIT